MQLRNLLLFFLLTAAFLFGWMHLRQRLWPPQPVKPAAKDQAKAKDKSFAWITAADVGLSKSLLAGEQYLLVRLRVTPVD